MRRSSLAKSSMPMVPPAVGGGRFFLRHRLRLGLLRGRLGHGRGQRVLRCVHHGLDLLRIDAGEQRRVGVDAARQQRRIEVGPAGHRRGEEGGGLRAGARQDRRQRGGQHAEQVQALRAHGLQFGIRAVAAVIQFLGDDPRLAVVDVPVGLVGQRHRLADRGGGIVALVGVAYALQRGDEARVLAGIRQRIGQPAAEALVDEAGAAAGQVDELADQVAVHPRGEIGEVQVEVVDAARGLRREVIAQRFRIQPGVEIGARHDEGAARLASSWRRPRSGSR